MDRGRMDTSTPWRIITYGSEITTSAGLRACVAYMCSIDCIGIHLNARTSQHAHADVHMHMHECM
eukprot:1249688-Pleurochrysis_carterae.AAC.2